MENCVLIIFGVTSTGEKFRPSDWIERFCGVMAPYDSTYQASGERVNIQKVEVAGYTTRKKTGIWMG